MSKQATKALIDANITANGTQAITGPILNNVLNTMVDDYGTQDEVSQLAQEITGIIQLGPWSLGSINVPANGHIPDYASNTRIRQPEMVAPYAGNFHITCNAGYEFLIYVVGKISTVTWSANRYVPLEKGDIFRLAVRQVPDVNYSSYTQEQIDAVGAASGLKMAIGSVNDRLTEVSRDVEGTPENLVLNVSAIISGITYVPNPLASGDAFTLKFILGAANWTRFAFSKNNTGTNWNTESANGNLYFWKQINSTGTTTWQDVAPDPAVYPYLMYQKPSGSNTIQLIKDAVPGLVERVADIEDGGVVKQTQLSTTTQINDVSGTIASGYNKIVRFTSPLLPGTEYRFTVDLSEETSSNISKLAHIYLLSNNLSNTQVGDIVSNYNKNTGGAQSFNVTPTDFVVGVNIVFQNTYSISGASLKIKTNYSRPAFGNYDNLQAFVNNSLEGKKILMLGDSITQLPYTDSTLFALAGMGIVEYSAIKLGAEVIRGAFGGSHLARRSATKPTSVTSDGEARALLDVPSIVEALVSGDWTLQEAAAAYTGVDVSWAWIVDALSAIDMSEVAAVTIFAGTNDMAGNAPLGDTDSKNPYYVNGAVNYIADIFCTAFPQVQLFIFTPCYRKFSADWADDSDYAEDYKNTLNLTLYDYVDAIIARAKENAVPVCDLIRTMGWNRYNYHAFCDDNDATHPRKGFQHLATRICGFMLSHQNRY